jgi:hypothetical protein
MTLDPAEPFILSAKFEFVSQPVGQYSLIGAITPTVHANLHGDTEHQINDRLQGDRRIQ